MNTWQLNWARISYNEEPSIWQKLQVSSHWSMSKINSLHYIAGFGVQYCNSMFISCFLFLLWPFTNFVSSPNDWILALQSSAKTAIRQDSLGLRLLPFLSGAQPKIECWIYTCLLTMFSHSAMSGVWLSPLLNIDDWSSKLS